MDLRIATLGAKGKGPLVSQVFGLEWGVLKGGEF
jgi:hypothetical protein